MYVPQAFKIEDPEAVLEIVRQNSFANLVSFFEGSYEATHLPLLIESEDPMVLAGHVAKANPIWRSFDGTQRVLAIFSGPHAYISPSTYAGSPNVPTWNYLAVHVHGTPQLIESSEETLLHLRRMVEYFDPHLEEASPASFDSAYWKKLENGLVAFRIVVDRVEGKRKLGQNKSEIDRRSAGKALLNSEDAEIGRLMLKI